MLSPISSFSSISDAGQAIIEPKLTQSKVSCLMKERLQLLFFNVFNFSTNIFDKIIDDKIMYDKIWDWIIKVAWVKIDFYNTV